RLGKKALEPSLTSFARVRDEVSKQRRGHTEALTRSAHPVRPETFVRRQVSWLTARSRPPPSRTTPVAKWRSLAAYSCGGSSGFARLAPLTGFPLRRSSRTVALTHMLWFHVPDCQDIVIRRIRRVSVRRWPCGVVGLRPLLAPEMDSS